MKAIIYLLLVTNFAWAQEAALDSTTKIAKEIQVQDLGETPKLYSSQLKQHIEPLREYFIKNREYLPLLTSFEEKMANQPEKIISIQGYIENMQRKNRGKDLRISLNFVANENQELYPALILYELTPRLRTLSKVMIKEKEIHNKDIIYLFDLAVQKLNEEDKALESLNTEKKYQALYEKVLSATLSSEEHTGEQVNSLVRENDKNYLELMDKSYLDSRVIKN